MLLGLLSALLAASSPASAATMPNVPPPPVESLMRVPEPLRALVYARVELPSRSPSDRLQALQALLSPGGELQMEYQEDATFTVAGAYTGRRANCVTYTLLFLALARQVGLDAYPQEIDQILSWQQQGDLVFRSNHVNAGVRLGSRRFVVDVGRQFVIARAPEHRIGEPRLLAQYYNNRAAVLLEQGDLPSALAHAQVALQLDPGYPVSWSNTGVVRLRSGDVAGAEAAYRKALALSPDDAGALFNLASLYERTGQRESQQAVLRRLEKLQSADPFHQFMLALEQERQGNGAAAVALYQRAIRLHRDQHQFHYALARACRMASKPWCARSALQRALRLAPDEPSRERYRQLIEQWRTDAPAPGSAAAKRPAAQHLVLAVGAAHQREVARFPADRLDLLRSEQARVVQHGHVRGELALDVAAQAGGHQVVAQFAP